MSIESVNKIILKTNSDIERLVAYKELAALYIYEHQTNIIPKSVIMVRDHEDSESVTFLEVGDSVYTKYGDSGTILRFEQYDVSGTPQRIVFCHNDEEERSENVERITV